MLVRSLIVVRVYYTISYCKDLQCSEGFSFAKILKSLWIFTIYQKMSARGFKLFNLRIRYVPWAKRKSWMSFGILNRVDYALRLHIRTTRRGWTSSRCLRRLNDQTKTVKSDTKTAAPKK